MECAICLGDIATSATGSCAHHFCYECLVAWCAANSTCPKCRHNIREIRLDPEFDQLLLGDDRSGGPTLKNKQPTVRLRLSPKHRAGITLTDPQSGAAAGLKRLLPSATAAPRRPRPHGNPPSSAGRTCSKPAAHLPAQPHSAAAQEPRRSSGLQSARRTLHPERELLVTPERRPGGAPGSERPQTT